LPNILSFEPDISQKELPVSLRIFRISREAVRIDILFFNYRLDLRNIRLHIWHAGFVPVPLGRVTGLREPSHPA